MNNKSFDLFESNPGKRISFLLGCLVVLLACVSCRRGVFVVSGSSEINGLYAPWDSLSDRTKFRCFSDAETFYFVYEVEDSTLTYTSGFKGEPDVEKEDRVEIFFSPGEDMSVYYCAEIDPLGRVLDYSSRYYRGMDYDWDFSTLRLSGMIDNRSYRVWGSVAKSELIDLGCDLAGGFYLGVFRADYRPDMTVNWYSAVSTDDEFPDFHKPDVLFKAIIK